MNLNPSFRTAAMLAIATVVTGGCSGKTEDVRFKLCKEVTERILESMRPIAWQEQTSQIRNVGDAVTRLSFTVGSEGYEGRPATAACFFRHDLPEESALDHANPLAAYSTLPYKMTINGKNVPDDILKQSVRAEQLEPFIEFTEQVKKEIGKLPIAK